jgi:hypothetical protein
VGRQLDIAAWNGDGRDEVLVTDDETTRSTYVVDMQNGLELDAIFGCSWARWTDWSEDGVPDIACITATSGQFELYETR